MPDENTDGTAVTDYVRTCGPVTLAESPISRWTAGVGQGEGMHRTRDQLKSKATAHNVRIFWPSNRHPGTYDGSLTVGVDATQIVYHTEEHTAETVITEWLSQNPVAVEESSIHGLWYNIRPELPPEWRNTDLKRTVEEYVADTAEAPA